MFDVLIIGAGPAGLIAADFLSARGFSVSIAERMPSPARKFLMAGRGGLNLTHTEPLNRFIDRYREASSFLGPIIAGFSPTDLRTWCHGLGQETFEGTSGRVFPTTMKASPLLRALLTRLSSRGVTLQTRLSWCGFEKGKGPLAVFCDETGQKKTIEAKAILLALGGASWPKLGSTGAWTSVLMQSGIGVSALRPANCGFHFDWSDHLKARFAGEPLKRLRISACGETAFGEAVVSQKGLEGGAVYAISAAIRNEIDIKGACTVRLDLRPDLSKDTLISRLRAPRGKQSMATVLRKSAGLMPLHSALLREAGPLPSEAEELAGRIKALPLTTYAAYEIDRAISSAGGIQIEEVNAHLMLKKLPGVFAAGEMLDWEAPTGGYLLQACFATGIQAAKGICAFLEESRHKESRS